jgi:hypothetical protein
MLLTSHRPRVCVTVSTIRGAVEGELVTPVSLLEAGRLACSRQSVVESLELKR